MACGEKTFRWRLCDRQTCIEESVIAARLGLTCPYQRLCPYYTQTRYERVI